MAFTERDGYSGGGYDLGAQKTGTRLLCHFQGNPVRYGHADDPLSGATADHEITITKMTIHSYQLHINGIAAEALVAEFGSPLYVYDAECIRYVRPWKICCGDRGNFEW